MSLTNSQHSQKRLKIERKSTTPPLVKLMSPIVVTSVPSPTMPLPPPLTFNGSLKHKLAKMKQSAIVAPVTGIVQVPTVTPMIQSTCASVLQSCQVVPQQRQPKEAPVTCKCPKEMMEKLETISSGLQSLAELVKDIQKQQIQLVSQASEAQQQMTNQIDKQSQCHQQLVQQLQSIREQQDQQSRQWEQFQQQQIQAQQNQAQAAQQLQQQQIAQQKQPPSNPQTDNHPTVQLQSIQVQPYQSQLQQISPSKGGQVQQNAITPISLGDGKFFIPSNNQQVQAPLQMIAIPSNMIQGLQNIQGIQSIQSLQSIQGLQNQGGTNYVQFVTQGSASTMKNTKCRQPEIRPKQPIAARPSTSDDPLSYNPSTQPGNTMCSPSILTTVSKTTNILEEASKVLSSHTDMETEPMELNCNYSLQFQSSPCQEKDVLSAAIMNIPTTYAQCDGIQQSFTESMRDVDTSSHGLNTHTTEILSQAINVVLLNPNDQENKVQVPAYLTSEVIDCIYRKSKEPSIYALNICREILTKDEFINNDFKSFVNKNPLKYKFVENLLSTKFCLYSDNLQSILKDVRIKFNNYHRHVKRACRLKEQQKLEQLSQQGHVQIDGGLITKQEPGSLDDADSYNSV